MSLSIDGRDYPASPTRNLLEVCLSLGLNLPYFCWHPALGSVGACRQCAVKQFKNEADESAGRGRIVMACMTSATEGLRVSLADREAHAFRAGVVEWLMSGHPHDCPVCDEGGACHLQDMTVMTGHNYRRVRAAKRSFINQYLGPFVNHEMNRCIACYRCVRFYRDYAGGGDLEALASRNRVYFGRAADGVLESEFAGNLVEVCPTGVFTDATLKQHYVRKWDMAFGPSLCPHCALGCNTQIGERAGLPRQVLNRYHHDLNGYFLCDRGRFGYGYMSAPTRLTKPLFRKQAGDPPRPVAAGPEGVPPPVAAGPEGVPPPVAELLRQAGAIIGIGSPRASLEANFALRQLVGPERFFAGVAEAEWRCLGLVLDLMRRLPVPVASLRQAEDSDAALLLGEDVLATAPRLGLALRRSTRHAALAAAERLKLPHWDAAAVEVAGQGRRSPLILATFASTRLDDAATAATHGSPDDLARFGFAVAHALDGAAPPVEGLDEAASRLAQDTAAALRAAERPLVVAGVLGGEALIRAAANVALALRRQGRAPRLHWVLPECNSLGLAMLGARPLSEALAGAMESALTVVLENDLYRRAPEPEIDVFLNRRAALLIDHTRHATAEAARAVLPAASVGDGSGTLVNSEGRAQRYFRAWPPGGEVMDSWRWLGRLARLLDGDAPAWESLDQITQACADAVPALAGIVAAAPPASFRLVGRKLPRQPQRASGRTALNAKRSVHEPPVPPDPDSALHFSMEGHRDEGQRTPAALQAFYWSPGWNSAQALNKFQDEVGGELRGGDPGARLIEAAADADFAFFDGVPAAFVPRPGEWLLLPRPLIFGSEELSVFAPAVDQRVGALEVLLHPSDIEVLALAGGERAPMRARIEVGDIVQHLAVRPDPAVTPGTAALPCGLPGQAWVQLPAWGRIGGAER